MITIPFSTLGLQQPANGTQQDWNGGLYVRRESYLLEFFAYATLSTTVPGLLPPEVPQRLGGSELQDT